MSVVGGGVNGGPHRPRVVELPPHDLEVEREVLYSILMRPQLLDDAAARVVPDDFYSAANGHIFETLIAMRRAGVDIDESTLRSELDDRKLLSIVGGIDYLLDLTRGFPFEKPQVPRLRRLAAMRRVSTAAHNLAIAARGGEGVDAATDALARAQKALADVDVPAEHPVGRLWKTLGEWGLLHRAPAPRAWLLTRPNEYMPEAQVGVMQRGKVGFLVAEGGAGKSIVLIQLALAVATGRRWLDHFGTKAGRVLIILAEEDEDEMHRRFDALSAAMRLTDAQVAQADANVVTVPLSGVSPRLVTKDGERAPFLAELRKRLDDGRGPWSLIILDPLSRFAGADTEKDNAAATVFIEAAESLLSVAGNPAVLIAHHTNKLSREQGAQARAGNARGASALTDGARWSCELQSRGDEGARLTIVKSNYAQQGQPLDLVRDGDLGGYLRAATPAELQHQREQREAERASVDQQKSLDVEQKVLAALEREPGLSKTKLAARTETRVQTIGRVVDALLADGRLLSPTPNAYAVAPPPEPPPPAQGELL